MWVATAAGRGRAAGGRGGQPRGGVGTAPWRRARPARILGRMATQLALSRTRSLAAHWNGVRRRAIRAIVATTILVTVGAVAWRHFASGPAAPAGGTVAFWTWHSRLPSQGDVDRAVAGVGARSLFVRAGQLDLGERGLTRIRPAQGAFPTGVELHLVYNATGRFLGGLEGVAAAELAALVRDTYAEDAARAAGDGARVAGVQLDLDAPTRLLRHYEALLGAVRRALPTGVALSVTGLPTWMESAALGDALAAVDFWVPQFYGAEVPARVERALPISSTRQVARGVERAAALGRPFYAGLAAYGYAIHYGRDGSMAEVRGDLDPAVVARLAGLELVERRPFEREEVAGRWRYLYRATQDCAVDGLELRRGEWLVLDVPTAEELRASARAARERGGRRMLGLCLFRLPAPGDRTALAPEEVVAALADAPAAARAVVRARRSGSGAGLVVEAENRGSLAALPGPGAVDVDVGVRPGSVRAASSTGGVVRQLGALRGALEPCSPARASVVRLAAAAWRPGDVLSIRIELAGEPPAALPVTIVARTPDGAEWRHEQVVEVQ